MRDPFDTEWTLCPPGRPARCHDDNVARKLRDTRKIVWTWYIKPIAFVYNVGGICQSEPCRSPTKTWKKDCLKMRTSR